MSDRLLFRLAGSQKRAHPDLAMTRTVLSSALIDSPFGTLMPDGFVLEAPARNPGEPFEVHNAFVRSLAMGTASLDATARRFAETLYPASWLDLTASLVACEFDEVRARLQQAIFDYERTEVAPNRRKSSTQRSRGSVDSFRSEAKRILTGLSLVAFDGRRFDPLVIPDMPVAGFVTVAPPLRDLRAGWRSLMFDIQSRLGGAENVEEELAWIEAHSSSTIALSGVSALTRNRATTGLLVTTAARADALGRVTVGDFVTDRLGPYPDHRRGPAVLLRPQKDLGRYDECWRQLPAEVGLIILVMLAVRSAHLDFRGLPPIQPTDALLVGRPTSRSSGDKTRICKWIAPAPGRGDPFVKRRPEHRSPDADPAVSGESGYTPHELRHFASQEAEIAGYKWEQRYPSREATSTPGSAYASALLLNGEEKDRMRALYGDRRASTMVEVLAGRAADLIYETVATDAGLRRRPDLHAYRETATKRRGVEAEADRVLARAARLHRRGSLLATNADEMSDREVLLAGFKETQELMREGFQIAHRLADLHQQKEDCIKVLDLLRLDRRTWLPISDDEPDNAERVDWNSVDAQVLGKPLLPGANDAVEAEHVRDWLTVPELCSVADDMPRSTAQRLITGQNEPRSLHRRPWSREAIPVDESLGAAYRRIWIPGVNPEFWRTRLMQEARDDLLSRWPEGKGWERSGKPTNRCHLPLVLADEVLTRAAALSA